MANDGAVAPPTARALVFALVSLLALHAAGAAPADHTRPHAVSAGAAKVASGTGATVEPEEAGRPPHRASQKPVRRGKPKVIGVLNVNRASEAELRLLPGIGKGRAALIVERRNKHPFASLDELARIRGMRKLVQKLRAHLAVSGDSTLRPAPPAAHPAPSAIHPAVHPAPS
jgi:competence protein ComEA